MSASVAHGTAGNGGVNGAPGARTLRIMVVDDEADMLTNYARLLRRTGYDCLTVQDPERAVDQLKTFRPDLIVTDHVMPGCSGLELLARLREIDPTIPVIMVTGYGSIENAVSAMKLHAADYLTKPFSVEELLGKIQEALSRRVLARDAGAEDAEEPPPEGIVGISPVLREAVDLARRVARTDVNVLIIGASGTGKEVFARAIHRLSARRNEIFVPVDCASLPEALLESELFGYRKGAFTGATGDKMGLFEFAHRGTLFLDEIGEMPLSLQAKLLRALQERRFRPIGGREEIEIDVRVIAATNRDLEQALRERAFRSDLYYRLNVVTLRLPTLRERIEDIPLLAHHFLKEFAADNHLSCHLIDPAALACLKAYDWPGNVRELQNVIEHAATMARGESILPQDLPEPVRRCASQAEVEKLPALLEAREHLSNDFERKYLIDLLVRHDFNISRAAEEARCNRRTLYRMIHRQGIDLRQLRRQS